jgi:hypothetical protein
MPNNAILFIIIKYLRLNNTINKQFEFMLRNNSFNKPVLLTAKFAYPSAFNCNSGLKVTGFGYIGVTYYTTINSIHISLFGYTTSILYYYNCYPLGR